MINSNNNDIDCVNVLNEGLDAIDLFSLAWIIVLSSKSNSTGGTFLQESMQPEHAAEQKNPVFLHPLLALAQSPFHELLIDFKSDSGAGGVWNQIVQKKF